MTKERVVVVGAGGQAKIIVDALLYSDCYEVVGYVDDFCPIGTAVYGFPVLGTISDLPNVCDHDRIDGGIVSLGDNFQRALFVQQIEIAIPAFHWVSAIHPSASIAHGSEIGKGVLMMAGSVVNPDCVIGDHCSIDTQASLDHDSTLNRFGSLAPNVATGGGCTIGEFTAISIGSSIVHGRTIGPHTVVGAGSIVISDIPDHVVAYGAPAKVIRQREEGETYL